MQAHDLLGWAQMEAHAALDEQADDDLWLDLLADLDLQPVRNSAVNGNVLLQTGNQAVSKISVSESNASKIADDVTELKRALAGDNITAVGANLSFGQNASAEHTVPQPNILRRLRREIADDVTELKLALAGDNITAAGANLSFGQRFDGHLAGLAVQVPFIRSFVERPYNNLQPHHVGSVPGADGFKVEDQIPVGVRVLTVIFFTILMFLAATCYQYQKPFPPQVVSGQAAQMNKDKFHFSLFGCLEDPRICCLVTCCLPFRWADTMRMMGFLSFPAALVLFVVLMELSAVWQTAGFMLFLFCLYYRQQMREKFGLPFGDWTLLEDCFAYTCCTCCAVIQEARQVEEAYQSKHPAVSTALSNDLDAMFLSPVSSSVPNSTRNVV